MQLKEKINRWKRIRIPLEVQKKYSTMIRMNSLFSRVVEQSNGILDFSIRDLNYFLLYIEKYDGVAEEKIDGSHISYEIYLKQQLVLKLEFELNREQNLIKRFVLEPYEAINQLCYSYLDREVHDLKAEISFWEPDITIVDVNSYESSPVYVYEGVYGMWHSIKRYIKNELITMESFYNNVLLNRSFGFGKNQDFFTEYIKEDRYNNGKMSESEFEKNYQKALMLTKGKKE